jgi:ketol-acid reductoisomerase
MLGKGYRRRIRSGQNPFSVEEAAKRGTLIQYLLSDAGQVATWDKVKKCLNPGMPFISPMAFPLSIKNRPKSFRRTTSMSSW